MEIHHYNPEDELVVSQEYPPGQEAELAVSSLCRNSLRLRPQAKYLFCLRNPSSGAWLKPDAVTKSGDVLELRLRFKVPGPNRLYGIDQRAFHYFYAQVRDDFKKGLVTNERSWVGGPEAQSSSSSTSLWFPVIEIKNGRHTEYLSDHYASATKLIALSILIHISNKSLPLKEALKNMSSYTPKGLWLGSVDRLFGHDRLKNNAKNLITTWQRDKASLLSLKMEFLSIIQEQFPGYFTETFPDVIRIDKGSHLSKVTLFVTAPFLSAVDPSIDKEPELRLRAEGRKSKEDELICSIEEICNVSAGSSEEIQILRKNGVPAYFRFKSSQERSNLLTLLCGYYRLCEKWIFSLSNEILYPSLNFLLQHNIHGPVHTDFVDKKFAERSGSLGGNLSKSCFYILHQDTESYDTLFLHVSDGKGKRRLTYNIKSSDGYTISPSVDGLCFFPSLGELMSALSSQIEMGRCLHPSEFDKDSGLLLCRSLRRLQSDASQSSRGEFFNGGSLFIPFRCLGRYESIKTQGTFTNVWKGQWFKSQNEKEIVAIKQLKREFESSKLHSFSNMSNKIMSCSDSTIVSVLGFCPSSCREPSAIILEYFSLGPLDEFLRRNAESLRDIELIEAAACLARAIWYLSEQRLVHGKIRCKSVFVKTRAEDSFKVKLGDPGIPHASLEKDIFWIPPEILSTASASSQLDLEYLETDIWSYSTTLWEIFTFGHSPHTPFSDLSTHQIIQVILGGERLPKPVSIAKEPKLLPMYHLMLKCWHPNCTLRSSPQQILKDVNHLFYRVYNSRMAHSYVTIQEPSEYVVNNVEDERDTSSCSSLRIDSPQFPPPPPPLSALPGGSSRDPLLSGPSHERRNSSDYGSSYLHSQSTSVYTAYFTYSQCTSIYSLGEHQLELNKDCPIGEGHFGIVYKGTISKSGGDWDEVAVKMLKEPVYSLDAQSSIRKEFDLLLKLRHENIVKIKGSLDESEGIIIIMEYLREGSLDKYLKVHESSLREDCGRRLFKYAMDITDGMEYLASKNIIHRDLAARNILVEDEDTVKIADFGLARISSDYYVMSSSSNIPIKWLAPECLTNKVYSIASDVWAFGVTLWEMFSYGAIPNLSGCEDFFNERSSEETHFADMQKFVEALLEGRRLPRRNDVSLIVYNELMSPCWEGDPKNRPNFTELKRMISSIELRVT